MFHKNFQGFYQVCFQSPVDAACSHKVLAAALWSRICWPLLLDLLVQFVFLIATHHSYLLPRSMNTQLASRMFKITCKYYFLSTVQDTDHPPFYSWVTLHAFYKTEWGRVWKEAIKALPVSNHLNVSAYNPRSMNTQPVYSTVLQDTELTGKSKLFCTVWFLNCTEHGFICYRTNWIPIRNVSIL